MWYILHTVRRFFFSSFSSRRYLLVCSSFLRFWFGFALLFVDALWAAPQITECYTECVCVWERDREIERKKDKEPKKYFRDKSFMICDSEHTCANLCFFYQIMVIFFFHLLHLPWLDYCVLVAVAVVVVGVLAILVAVARLYEWL